MSTIACAKLKIKIKLKPKPIHGISHNGHTIIRATPVDLKLKLRLEDLIALKDLKA